MKSYRPVLIIDDRIAYFGFPTHSDDRQMHVAIRISNESLEGSQFVKDLTHWYDSRIPKNGQHEDSLILFGIKKR